MTEMLLRSITNSGTWMPILVPTYSTKIFIGRTFMTTYVVPFVRRYVTCPRFDRRYPIPSSISLPASLFTRSVMHHLATNSSVALLARLIVMCINERAQRYLRQSEWQILISIYANSTSTIGDTRRAPLWSPSYVVTFGSTQSVPPVFGSCIIS